MFQEAGQKSYETTPPLSDCSGELKELKNTIEYSDPEKRIRALVEKHPQDSKLIQELRDKKADHFSKYFVQKIAGKAREKEFVLLVAEDNPLYALPLWQNYHYRSYKQEVIDRAIESSFKQLPSLALVNLQRYSDKEYGRKMVEELFKNDKTELLFFFRTLIQDPGYGIRAGKSYDFVNGINAINQTPKVKKFFGDFLNHFVNSNITIGKKVITLQFPQHLNLFSGLLKTFDQLSPEKQKDPIQRDDIKNKYEQNLNLYIKQGAEMAKVKPDHNHVFIIRASRLGGDDYNDTFDYYNTGMRTYYRGLTIEKNFVDYSSDINPKQPSEIIAQIQKAITNNPDDHFYIQLGLHGLPNGDALYTWGDKESGNYHETVFSKEDFNKLTNLQSNNPERIHLDLESCYSGNKDDNYRDNTVLNVVRSSGKQLGYATRAITFFQALTQTDPQDPSGQCLEADYDGDGHVNYHEAMVYIMEHYNDSLTPMTFDYNGQAIDISMKDKEELLPTS